ncbi:hypothetical protein IG193_08705 [Infirmifilum lucidum]|uniref:Uncharacterized protein n=1 Tax=Infirmifilum lucidum TaxID=2776706 RepID=A0A7L9FHI6_9CREN|nr:hypothetical protein [Infirmifilum lucidum]QOJ78812.1 hypothetical protein IG193_08705 [Infirmifilum lucidum]
MRLVVFSGGWLNYSSRRVMNYYLVDRDFIPATTLRGAILAEMYSQKGSVDEDFYTSPAFPVLEVGAEPGRGGASRRLAPTAPPHALVMLKGRKGREAYELEGCIGDASSYGPLLEALKAVHEKLKEKLESEPKPALGGLVAPLGKSEDLASYARVSPEATVEMHVAISKRTGSSMKGMLYAYEYKRAPKYWALVAETEAADYLKPGVALRVGRGRSRAPGALRVEKVVGVKAEELAGPGVGYCITPCVPRLFGREVFQAGGALGYYDIYNAWFTVDGGSGFKPAFRVLAEGALVEVRERASVDLRPAGLNLILSIGDLYGLLGEVARHVG